MDFLKQLEQQAEQKRAREEQLAAEASERGTRYHQVTEPAMQRLLDYLKQLTSHLNYLEARPTIDYQLPFYGKVSAITSTDYKTQFSSQEHHSEIRLGATAVIDRKQSPEVLLRAPVADQFNELLSEHGLHAHRKGERSARGQLVEATFQVYGTINIAVSIRADLDNDVISMSFTNVDRLGSYRRTVDPERVDDVFLDDLGRFLSRDRDVLMQEELSTEIRNKLRRNLRKDASRLKVLRGND